jgi:hypothetical protein
MIEDKRVQRRSIIVTWMDGGGSLKTSATTIITSCIGRSGVFELIIQRTMPGWVPCGTRCAGRATTVLFWEYLRSLDAMARLQMGIGHRTYLARFGVLRTLAMSGLSRLRIQALAVTTCVR